MTDTFEKGGPQRAKTSVAPNGRALLAMQKIYGRQRLRELSEIVANLRGRPQTRVGEEACAKLAGREQGR